MKTIIAFVLFMFAVGVEAASYDIKEDPVFNLETAVNNDVSVKKISGKTHIKIQGVSAEGKHNQWEFICTPFKPELVIKNNSVNEDGQMTKEGTGFAIQFYMDEEEVGRPIGEWDNADIYVWDDGRQALDLALNRLLPIGQGWIVFTVYDIGMGNDRIPVSYSHKYPVGVAQDIVRKLVKADALVDCNSALIQTGATIKFTN
ncbi:hypothetical protein PQC07_gp021 [Aeromonas phage D3]|uniref:Uncharacterized protein n=3 Tax=Ludhianavirus TaxID=3044751 RepID=A0A514A1J8_9CAUD|nr:hypothetical protein PQC06_gp166 [Aeromonas phage LAh10]YP_010668735.1 hypothetical protein PQC07_gp021 [Aeromonas phage D3]YP_010669002.1 hypothetical protein PQC08_gp021 [Aeromonas phage D6]QDH47147.1 hypothetical protein LAh10_166 [Aeromonas phage LAh10]QDJ96984.1 hypothetical protein D3_0254 [Aeromonas phage D3]QDJ97413.1 hypothetical protein D6_0254 [Aeromonas phage D6]